eukprot:TRINITY_DN29620_c0_g1_i2.p1 TRINITY_DN29620_c0_g1~~TRINITY_DN29620_c0_g1_i2.p1  ORF type:complete len:216 (-),score=38.00 TRINITY_DN29620_c0_g1_i2:3-650(-)
MGLACGDSATADSLQCLFPRSNGFLKQKQLFAIELRHSEGTLTLGDVPNDFISGLVYMPVQSCGHWEVALAHVSCKEQQYLDGPSGAILDSGTDAIVGPTFAVISLANALGATTAPAVIEGYGGQVTFYQVPCDARATLPNVTLVLGGSGSQAAQVALSGEQLVAPAKGDAAGDLCYLRLAGWATDSWILGAAFFEAIRGVVFDATNRRVAVSLF